MTKAEYATIIMNNTDEHKKSHLAKMHIADLAKLAEPYMKVAPSEVEFPVLEEKSNLPCVIPFTREIVADAPEASSTPERETISRIFDEHKKLVRGPRIDKDEFKKVAIETVIAKLPENADIDTMQNTVVAVINELLENKTHFCPINDTEKIMLATIPQLDDFSGIESEMNGKGFLAKIKEIHDIDIASTRSLMVSLCRKGFYTIKGIKSGQKFTTIHLEERGIRYLRENGLIA